MAELRSFLIGVVVAGVFLGIVAVALGAFSGEDSDPVVARLLGSPVATATPRVTPGAQTTALPTLAATTQPSPTPMPTEDAAPEPTQEPTSTPAPQPTVNPIDLYLAVIQPIVGDLEANITYVIGQGSSNPAGSSQAADTIKNLAGRMASTSPPACLSNAHGTLTQGSGQAAAAADQLLAALSASNDGLVQAALSAMETARGTLGSGTASISAAAC